MVSFAFKVDILENAQNYLFSEILSHLKPCRYLYLAIQMTKGMVKVTMALLQCSASIMRFLNQE